MDIPAQVDARVVDMVVMEVKVMEKMLLGLVMVHIYSQLRLEKMEDIHCSLTLEEEVVEGWRSMSVILLQLMDSWHLKEETGSLTKLEVAVVAVSILRRGLLTEMERWIPLEEMDTLMEVEVVVVVWLCTMCMISLLVCMC